MQIVLYIVGENVISKYGLGLNLTKFEISKKMNLFFM